MGGVELVYGLWVGECVGKIPTPLAYQPVHWRCKRTTSNLNYASFSSTGLLVNTQRWKLRDASTACFLHIFTHYFTHTQQKKASFDTYLDKGPKGGLRQRVRERDVTQYGCAHATN